MGVQLTRRVANGLHFHDGEGGGEQFEVMSSSSCRTLFFLNQRRSLERWEAMYSSNRNWLNTWNFCAKNWYV